jgi:hypothetical protein
VVGSSFDFSLVFFPTRLSIKVDFLGLIFFSSPLVSLRAESGAAVDAVVDDCWRELAEVGEADGAAAEPDPLPAPLSKGLCAKTFERTFIKRN